MFSSDITSADEAVVFVTVPVVTLAVFSRNPPVLRRADTPATVTGTCDANTHTHTHPEWSVDYHQCFFHVFTFLTFIFVRLLLTLSSNLSLCTRKESCFCDKLQPIVPRREVRNYSSTNCWLSDVVFYFT